MDEGALYDSVTNFLLSPQWTLPIISFVEEKCVVFDNEEENKLEFTVIHKEYQNLVEALFKDYLEEFGISEEDVSRVIASVTTSGHHSEGCFLAVTAADDYLVFKEMMVSKNKELEEEVRKLWNVRYHEREIEFQSNGDDVEDESIKEAIRQSLLEAQRNSAGEEEEQLQMVMELSRLEAEKAAAQAAHQTAADEEALAQVLKLSLQEHQAKESEKSKKGEKGLNPVPLPSALPPLRGVPNNSGPAAAAAAATITTTTTTTSTSTAHSAAASSAGAGASADADMEKRKEYLREQRERILALRNKQRKAQIEQADSASKDPKRLSAEESSDLKFRRLLANRLKEEVVQGMKK